MPESNYVPVRRSERFASLTARRIGAAARDEVVCATIVLRGRPDGAVLPRVEELSAADGMHRRRLSRSVWNAPYGASDEDIAAVSAFAVAHGLEVVEAHAARRSVVVRSTVARMGEAFRVDLGLNEHESGSGESENVARCRDRDGAAHVPAGLSAIVIGVYGLENCPLGGSNAGAPEGTG